MSTPHDIIRAVKDELEAAGIEVTLVPGWEGRGRPGDFVPRGLVCHHTATNRNAPGDYPSLGIVRDGRPDLAGPLAQFGLGRTGRVLVIAAGKSNHAGPGGFNGLSGNSTVWGIEAENDGTGGEPWPAAQIEAYHRLSAALARHTGFGVASICGHKEWTPEKIDPLGIDMDDFRAAVAQLLDGKDNPNPKPTLTIDTEDTSMFIFDGPNGGVFRTDGVTRWPIRSMATASVLLDVAHVRHLGKLSAEAFGDLRDGEATANGLQDELDRLRDQLTAVAQKVEVVATRVATLN